ncbi:polysaccharide biosynthesis tyrosine autokinase [Nocardioides sp. HDW12B]|uniref:tyrosine-protein kinase family protein n=1 Tax=Nocardioides sp. HDW12B TaxID=2714939 RepID=UPI00140AE99D|nr:tyrosine-protein kinase family protein [Nocardioides sp. HDW12B]QIK65380.1 polysaccharide biosynthesis tyrosine autokinase [Nocardioides sp. HDW12B]
MTLRDYIRALRKRWWLVVAAALAGASLSAVWVQQLPPVYQGTVTFFATTPSLDPSSPLQSDLFGQQRVNSYVRLLKSELMAERVVADTDLDLSEREVMTSVEGKADLNTVLLTAEIRNTSPDRVQAITESVAVEMPSLVEEIESEGGQAPVLLRRVSGPTINTSPVSPQKELWVAAGLLLGLALGVAVALLRGLLDRTVRTPEDLRERMGAPVLGRIPAGSSKRMRLLAKGKMGWAHAEAFRQLRTNLQFVDIEKPVSVLAVTSSLPAEGKSSTAAYLAVSFSEAGKRVLLIEGDLRRPVLADIFGLEGGVGLTNVLAHQVLLDEVVQPWGTHGLHFLASGPIPPNPSELLGSDAMVKLLVEARGVYDLVVIDTPPLLPVTDGAITAAGADGAIVVVRYSKTRTNDVQRALENLRAVDARVLGTVLNRAPLKGQDSYTYEKYTDKGARVRRGQLR